MNLTGWIHMWTNRKPQKVMSFIIQQVFNWANSYCANVPPKKQQKAVSNVLRRKRGDNE